jgi:hypothetical protein
VVREGTRLGDDMIKVVAGLGIKPMEDLRKSIREEMEHKWALVRR